MLRGKVRAGAWAIARIVRVAASKIVAIKYAEKALIFIKSAKNSALR